MKTNLTLAMKTKVLNHIAMSFSARELEKLFPSPFYVTPNTSAAPPPPPISKTNERAGRR